MELTKKGKDMEYNEGLLREIEMHIEGFEFTIIERITGLDIETIKNYIMQKIPRIDNYIYKAEFN